MLKTYVRLSDTIRHLPARLHREERGQDAFEYLLVIGVVMVAVITAVVAGFTPATLVSSVNGLIKTAIEGLFS